MTLSILSAGILITTKHISISSQASDNLEYPINNSILVYYIGDDKTISYLFKNIVIYPEIINKNNNYLVLIDLRTYKIDQIKGILNSYNIKIKNTPLLILGSPEQIEALMINFNINTFGVPIAIEKTTKNKVTIEELDLIVYGYIITDNDLGKIFSVNGENLSFYDKIVLTYLDMEKYLSFKR